MLLLAESISRLKVRWNERPLTEEDFHRLCKRHKVTVQEMPLRVSGFYYCVMGRHFIAIDSKLTRAKKLFVMFHEFAHYLLHAPDGAATANYHGVGRRDRKEIEADAFALCALMPKAWVESDRFAEMAEEEGFDLATVRDRLEIYDRFAL
jgi:Zn-dependent peptidase ImmA (M78 family)